MGSTLGGMLRSRGELRYHLLAGEQHAGALLECGAALGAGRSVFAVSAVEFSFLAHPRCRLFENLAAAVQAVTARQAGEAARLVALAGEHGRAA
jgi:hypothetical protein